MIRLQFDFSRKAVERLDELKVVTGSGSRAEIIRNALRVYEYLVEMKEEGYKIQLGKNQETTKGIALPI